MGSTEPILRTFLVDAAIEHRLPRVCTSGTSLSEPTCQANLGLAGCDRIAATDQAGFAAENGVAHISCNRR
jgi:hypothetical protein